MIAEREATQRPPTPTLELLLTVDDPEVVREIERQPHGPERDRFVATALRLGVLALRQASGVIDSGTIRQEGERILHDLDSRLGRQLGDNLTRISETLKRYFDPASGDLAQRIERLVRKDGDLEAVLSRHLAGDDSTVARTLAAHIGENSPIFKLLSPKQTDGILATLGSAIEDALASQREKILGQFSLDDADSALSRLVRELTGSHGQLKTDLAKDLDRVRAEFSLDNENGALSRLVGRVEKAHTLIANQFSLDQDDSALSRIARLLESTNQTVASSLTLDDDGSALSRLKRELLDVVGELGKANKDFHTEVRESIAALNARRAEADRSTRHGGEFEDAVGAVLQTEAQRLGDVFEATGATTGAIPYAKSGDHVITLGVDSAAPEARIVCEAKEHKSYNLRQALAEIDKARRNREAPVGVFVFSKRTAPEGLEPLFRQGHDIVVVWDREDPATDVFLKAAVSLARALVVRQRAESEQAAIDFGAIDAALVRVTKDAERLDDITRMATTVRSNGDKILDAAKRIRKDLDKQIDTLREHVDRLRPSGVTS